MKAILTRYVGPSNVRGSRIIATAEGGDRPHRLTVPYDHSSSDPHADAAVALCRKLGWTGELIGGGLPNGDNCYVFAESDRHTI